MSELKTWVNTQACKTLPLLAACYLDQTGSTNDEAMDYFRSGGRGPSLFVAGAQSAGRGRLGRAWESRPGLGLYFSLLIHPDLPSAQTPLISLAVGLGLKRALSAWSIPDLILKWPNDLWVQKKKIAGVLSESVGGDAKSDAVVVGIGVNLQHKPEDFSEELRPIATSLRQVLAQDIGAAPLLQKILPALFSELELLQRDGTSTLTQRWEKESAMPGCRVRIREGASEWEGEVLGLNEHGHLTIKKNDGTTKNLISGDVFLI